MSMGLTDAEAQHMGADAALRIRTFRLLMVLSQRMRTAMDRSLEPEGFTSQQALVYTAVDARGPVRLTELARVIGMTHQNLRQLVGALERKGMLAVEPDPDDGRARRISVTRAGREHWAARPGTGHDVVHDWFERISPDELALTFDVLERLNQRL